MQTILPALIVECIRLTSEMSIGILEGRVGANNTHVL